MAILTVKENDGTVVTLPNPSELTWGIDDIDSEDTTRNQLGDLFRDRVASKRKIESIGHCVASGRLGTGLAHDTASGLAGWFDHARGPSGRDLVYFLMAAKA